MDTLTARTQGPTASRSLFLVSDSGQTENPRQRVPYGPERAIELTSKGERYVADHKAIYLELHPETAHGSPGVSRQVGDTQDRADAERFTTDTAKATGQSERSVQRDAERGEKVIDLTAWRAGIEAEIERLIGLLDAVDGDADDEPVLGSPEKTPGYGWGGIDSQCSQAAWADGFGDWHEDVNEDGGDDVPAAPNYPDDPDKPQYLSDQWFI